jgi:hypothetical protein
MKMTPNFNVGPRSGMHGAHVNSNVSVHWRVHEHSNEASASVKARELLTFTLAFDLFKNILNGIMKY